MSKAKPVTKATKPTTKAGGKATTTKAEPKKVTKATTTKGTAEPKKTKKNMTQCVGFIYGGDLIKGSHAYLFQCDTTDPVTHVRETLVPYFGGNVIGRYVKCEDAEGTMATILENAETKGFNTDSECQHILKCNVTDASELIKTAAGSNIAHVLKLTENEPKPKKESTSTAAKGKNAKSTKGNKKAAEEDEAEDEEAEDEAEDEEGEDDEVSDEEDEEDEEDDEEEEEPPKKTTGKGAKPTTTTGKGAKPNSKPAPKKGSK